MLAVTARAALEARRLEPVSSWGGSARAMSYVYRPASVDEIGAVFAAARDAGVSVGLRGTGCSYGDASMNAEGIALDTTRLDRILDFDQHTGIARVEPGVTIEKLWKHCLPLGYWPAVVPGTMFPTIGGCAAMNIHGKNNFGVGTIGDQIDALRVALPNGESRRLSRSEDSSLFHAVIGGFGVLAVITEVTLRLKRVHSGLLEVEPVPTRDLDEMFAAFEARAASADYLVGWVDGFATGNGCGRGLVHAARYLRDGEDPQPQQTSQPQSQALPARLFGVLPMDQVWRLMAPFANDPGWQLVNLVKYLQGRAAGSGKYRQSLAAFSFLLDFVPGWKRAYGPGGLIQYQSFIPAAAAPQVLRRQLETCRRHGSAALSRGLQAAPRRPVPDDARARRLLARARLQVATGARSAAPGALRGARSRSARRRRPLLLRQGQPVVARGAHRARRRTAHRTLPRAEALPRSRGPAAHRPLPAGVRGRLRRAVRRR